MQYSICDVRVFLLFSRRPKVTVAGALAAAADDRCTDTGSSTNLLQIQILARHQGPLV